MKHKMNYLEKKLKEKVLQQNIIIILKVKNLDLIRHSFKLFFIYLSLVPITIQLLILIFWILEKKVLKKMKRDI